MCRAGGTVGALGAPPDDAQERISGLDLHGHRRLALHLAGEVGFRWHELVEAKHLGNSCRCQGLIGAGLWSRARRIANRLTTIRRSGSMPQSNTARPIRPVAARGGRSVAD